MSTRALSPPTQLHIHRRRIALAPAAAARVDFVLPVFNEADTLAASVRELHDHLTLELPFTWRCYMDVDLSTDLRAIRRDVARRLVPEVRDDGWFFDTELLVLAQRSHLRIHEVPVDWIEDPRSSVAIVRTAREDLRGVLRLLLRRGARPPRPRLRTSGSAAS